MSRMKSITALTVVLGLVVASMAYAQGGSSTTDTTKTTTTHTKTVTTPAPPAKPSAMKHAAMAKVDINSASNEDLEKTGLDDATATKIIAGRPYKKKAELLSKGILTKEDYAKISKKIFVKKMAVAKAKAK